MQAVLWYHEADTTGSAATQIEAITVNRERGPGEIMATAAGVVRRSGSVDLPSAGATALWWMDAETVQVLVVSYRHSSPHPAVSQPVHLAVRFEHAPMDVFVSARAVHDETELLVTAISGAADLTMTPIRVRRESHTSVLAADIGKSSQLQLSLGRTKQAVAIAQATPLAKPESMLTLLAASPAGVFVVHLDATQRVEELAVWEPGQNGPAHITSIAFSHGMLLAGLDTRKVCAVALEQHTPAQVVAEFELGSGVLPRAIAATADAAPTFLCVGHDRSVGANCVVRVEFNPAMPAQYSIASRTTGFAGSSVASLPVGVPSARASVAWNEKAGAASMPGLVSGAGATLIYRAAGGHSSMRVAVPSARAALSVAAGDDLVTLLIAGESRRVRVYAVTPTTSLHPVPYCIATGVLGHERAAGFTPAFAPAVESIPTETPLSAEEEIAQAEAGMQRWHALVARGCDLACHAADGIDLVRRLMALGTARPTALTRSELFEVAAAQAQAAGYEGVDPSTADVTAAVEALGLGPRDVCGPCTAAGTLASWCDINVDGVFLPAAHRYVGGLVQHDLTRRLQALVLCRLAVAAGRNDASRDILATAMLRVAAALAVMRSAGSNVASLSGLEAEEPTAEREYWPCHVLQGLLGVHEPPRGDLGAAAVAACRVASNLRAIPHTGTAIRATGAFVQTCVDHQPVLRHFVVCDMLARRAGAGQSSTYLGHVLAVNDALGTLDGSAAAQVVGMIAPDVCADIPNDLFYDALVTPSHVPADVQHARARSFYCAAVAQALLADVTAPCLVADDAQVLLPHIDALLSSDALQPEFGVPPAVRDTLAQLQLHILGMACGQAAVGSDFAGALLALHKMTQVESETTALAINDHVRHLVARYAAEGRAWELATIMVSADVVSDSVARALWELVLNPKTDSAERAAREERRVEIAVALHDFLLSRGATGSAAFVAYETAAAMRSAPQRSEGTLARALTLLSMALNTAQLIPEHVTVSPADDDDAPVAFAAAPEEECMLGLARDSTTVFSPASEAAGPTIGSLTRARIPEIRRRWQHLRCESLLANRGAAGSACLPWAALENELAPLDKEAVERTVRDLIHARLWRDALVLAEAWSLETQVVFNSHACDLLESSEWQRYSWDDLSAWLEARSTSKNNHQPLVATLTRCLHHRKYRGVPTAFKELCRRSSGELSLAAYLGMGNISGTMADDALAIGTAYCNEAAAAAQARRRPDFPSVGLSASVISVGLLDRLADLARDLQRKADVGQDLAARARDFLTAFDAYGAIRGVDL